MEFTQEFSVYCSYGSVEITGQFVNKLSSDAFSTCLMERVFFIEMSYSEMQAIHILGSDAVQLKQMNSLDSPGCLAQAFETICSILVYKMHSFRPEYQLTASILKGGEGEERNWTFDQVNKQNKKFILFIILKSKFSSLFRWFEMKLFLLFS